jgi:hypothetical protein
MLGRLERVCTYICGNTEQFRTQILNFFNHKVRVVDEFRPDALHIVPVTFHKPESALEPRSS